MEFLGLLVEVLLLALGVYLYLFARGIIKVKDPERRERVESFRQQNATWMRLLGLALAAIMLMNVVLHVSQLFSSTS
ncbi:hypothetical protein [Lewinella cohaerens]|uniref:hypothetical protein n=1 Tax=Lewinella cohaerens TaxID=70995 RepID=UPI000373A4C6|nr:hypothetical protein [Lewinella cohaerens]